MMMYVPVYVLCVHVCIGVRPVSTSVSSNSVHALYIKSLGGLGGQVSILWGLSLGTYSFYMEFSLEFLITQTYSAYFSLLLLSFYDYIHNDHPSILIVYSPSGHDIPYTRESTRLTPFCCYIYRRYFFEYWSDRFFGMILDLF